jgi:hypothetical protein
MTGDSFTPRKDGSITIDATGYRYTLPPILLGQYVTLRSETDRVGDEPTLVAWSVRAVAMLSGWWIQDPPAWFADPDLPVRMIEHWRNWPIPLFDSPRSEHVDPRREQMKPKPKSRTFGVYQEVAPIYEALAMRSVSDGADLLPLWRVAAVLGQHTMPEREGESDTANRFLAGRQAFGRGDPVDPDAAPVGPSARRSKPRAVPAEGSLAPIDPTEVLRLRIEAAEKGRAAPKWKDEQQGVSGALLTNLT